MRRLLNTLYVTTENAYLSLKDNSIVVNVDDEIRARIPLHTLESIVCFSYPGASPALIGKCISEGIGISFFSPNGQFYYRGQGREHGNVLVRKEQYRIADNKKKSLEIARNMIIGKVYNSRSILERHLRDHPLLVDSDKLRIVSADIKDTLFHIADAEDIDQLRALEGKAAQQYFSVINELVLQQKDHFRFISRNRRPPLDNFNALLSFTYSLLIHDCANACESVGLDPYVGFMHQLRSGRESLALDLMEEFRPVIADRFVLKLINKKIVQASDLEKQDSGAVYINDNARKILIKEWQTQKTEEIKHPFLNERINWGLSVYSQALLLSRTIRGDIDAYPPFFWR